ncbi:MAG: NAD(P)H-hydrate epimerase [Candidatus Heimdallarchaeota archaeon]|nr:NAD(P)H-hydrate epimerase [Candidatus Heimdallarchaeota archaeon]
MDQHYPIIPANSIPFITVEQMIEVDRLMMEEYQISLVQMMENAAYNLALLSKTLYPEVENFIILAGKGNNGGGGLGAARRLHNWGFSVTVLLASEEESLKAVPAKQLEILKKLKIRILHKKDDFDKLLSKKSDRSLIIDALLGYSLKGNPRGNYEYLINKANESDLPIISLDIPSGIEGTEGLLLKPAIKANITVTLALPKTAFLNKTAKPNLGRLFVADISVPIELYEEMGVKVKKSLFHGSSIVEIKQKKE